MYIDLFYYFMRYPKRQAHLNVILLHAIMTFLFGTPAIEDGIYALQVFLVIDDIWDPNSSTRRVVWKFLDQSFKTTFLIFYIVTFSYMYYRHDYDFLEYLEFKHVLTFILFVFIGIFVLLFWSHLLNAVAVRTPCNFILILGYFDII